MSRHTTWTCRVCGKQYRLMKDAGKCCLGRKDAIPVGSEYDYKPCKHPEYLKGFKAGVTECKKLLKKQKVIVDLSKDW